MIPGWLLVLIVVDRFILSTFLHDGSILKNKRTKNFGKHYFGNLYHTIVSLLWLILVI
jgi:hypothetical protein